MGFDVNSLTFLGIEKLPERLFFLFQLSVWDIFLKSLRD